MRVVHYVGTVLASYTKSVVTIVIIIFTCASFSVGFVDYRNLRDNVENDW